MSCGAVNTGIALRLSCLSVSSCSGRVSWWSRKRSCSAIAGDQEQWWDFHFCYQSNAYKSQRALKAIHCYPSISRCDVSNFAHSPLMTADLLSDPGSIHDHSSRKRLQRERATHIPQEVWAPAAGPTLGLSVKQHGSTMQKPRYIRGNTNPGCVCTRIIMADSPTLHQLRLQASACDRLSAPCTGLLGRGRTAVCSPQPSPATDAEAQHRCSHRSGLPQTAREQDETKTTAVPLAGGTSNQTWLSCLHNLNYSYNQNLLI